MHASCALVSNTSWCVLKLNPELPQSQVVTCPHTGARPLLACKPGSSELWVLWQSEAPTAGLAATALQDAVQSKLGNTQGGPSLEQLLQDPGLIKLPALLSWCASSALLADRHSGIRRHPFKNCLWNRTVSPTKVLQLNIAACVRMRAACSVLKWRMSRGA